MKKLIFLSLLTLFAAACAGDGNTESNNSAGKSEESQEHASSTDTYDPNRGEGKFADVKVGDKLDPAMAQRGENLLI
ncbi:hypothetical protein [Pedobacter steynii]